MSLGARKVFLAELRNEYGDSAMEFGTPLGRMASVINQGRSPASDFVFQIASSFHDSEYDNLLLETFNDFRISSTRGPVDLIGIVTRNALKAGALGAMILDSVRSLNEVTVCEVMAILTREGALPKAPASRPTPVLPVHLPTHPSAVPVAPPATPAPGGQKSLPFPPSSQPATSPVPPHLIPSPAPKIPGPLVGRIPVKKP